MTDKRFVEEYSGAPYDTEQLAQIAIGADGDIAVTAQDYLDALERFEKALEEAGFVWG